MTWYVLACDSLAHELSPDELNQLRQSGELPAWFLPKIRPTARNLRRTG
jgi:hypothetical protein